MQPIVNRPIVISSAEHPFEHTSGKFAANHRCNAQHVARPRIEAREPRQNHVLYRVWDVDCSGRMRETDRVATSFERSALVECPDHLLEKKRIAIGLLVEQPLQ